MYIYQQCPLIAKKNDDKNQMYFNNEIFEVVAYDKDQVYLLTERSNDIGELKINSIEVSHTDIQKLFYLNYCSSIQKVQGSTTTECFAIWDWNPCCMNKKAKYTALPRETCPENTSIVGEYNEDDCNDNKIRQKLKAYAKTDAEKGLQMT